MKKLVVILFALTLTFACKDNNNQAEETNTEVKQDIAYASFGDEINDADAIDAKAMLEKYNNLKEGDTVMTKMRGKIKEVCSVKGCWMTLDIDGEHQVMVKFKDYGFFMPLNAEGEVVINGKAFVTETSVEELRHYAQDAGKSEEEIAAITEPKLEYRFEADGVLLKQ